jgi:hypothetical protein
MIGINSGLSIYDRDYDATLYRATNLKPLDNVSFDKINDDLDKYENNYNKQDDIYIKVLLLVLYEVLILR